MQGIAFFRFSLGLLALGLWGAGGPLALGEEDLAARDFDVSDIVRALPEAGPPGEPLGGPLTFNGLPLAGLLASRGALWADWSESARKDPPSFFSGLGGPDAIDLHALGEMARKGLEEIGLPEAEVSEVSKGPPCVRVRAKPEALRAVERSFAELAREANTEIAIEAILLPEEVLSRIAPAWAPEGPVLSDEVFREALLHPSSRLLRAVARNGQAVAAGLRDFRPIVSGSEVDQTGVIPVNQPVIEAPPAGEALTVRPILLAAGDAVWLDLALGRRRVQAEAREIGEDWGCLELPIAEKVWISTSAVVRPGNALVAGSVGGKGGLTALVRASVRRPAVPPPEGGGTGEKAPPAISAHDLSPLLEGSGRTWPPGGNACCGARVSFLSSWAGDFDLGRCGFYARRPRWGCEFLTERLREAGIEEGGAWWRCPRLYVFGDRAAKVREFVARELEKLSRLIAIDVRVWSAPRGCVFTILERAEGGRLLPEGWERELEGERDASVERYFVTGAQGEMLGLLASKEKSLVVGAREVSGGTGYAVLQRSSIDVRSFADGTELWLQAVPSPDATCLRIAVGGLRVRLVEERPVAVTILSLADPIQAGSAQPSGSSDAGTAQGMAIAERRKKIQLTLPRQAAELWSAETEVPSGRDVVLQVDAPEGDRATLLVARARPVP